MTPAQHLGGMFQQQQAQEPDQDESQGLGAQLRQIMMTAVMIARSNPATQQQMKVIIQAAQSAAAAAQGGGGGQAQAGPASPQPASY